MQRSFWNKELCFRYSDKEINMTKTYICNLCPRSCNAERYEEYGRGYCKMGTLPRIARAAPHMWEEPCISGTNGSGTIFFSGCVLSCVFCQNYEISAGGKGKTVTVGQLVDHIRSLEQLGVHNINLVSPTPYIEAIIDAFTQYKPHIPVVYNTGGYEKAETIKRLEGIVDIYLPDMKYISSELSAKYSRAGDYAEYAGPAIAEMVRQTGKPIFDDNGIMQRGTIVRHLILPSNTKNSIAVLDYLDRNFGSDILISLMGQYFPAGNAKKYTEINRTITKREYDKVLSALDDMSLDGFAQELDSATEKYVPDFDISVL